MLGVLRHYVVMAVRVLLRKKLFTAISLFGITFTLTALLLATAFLDHAFGPVPPEVNQGRTVYVSRTIMLGERRMGFSVPRSELIERYLRDLPGSERMSVIERAGHSAACRNGVRSEFKVKRTDEEFWNILEFSFIEGGPFTSEDVRTGRQVAVISESTRAAYFDGEPALGRTLELGGRRLQVVGVVRDVSPVRLAPFADVWAPIADRAARPRDHRAEALLMAKAPADVPRMRRELRARLDGWQHSDPRVYQRLIMPLDTQFEMLSRAFGADGDEESHPERLWAFLVVVGLLFMLLPAVNLVNLNVSRILDRASEIGVRKAFGASSRTLVLQFLIENVILTLVGAAVALVLTASILRALEVHHFFAAMRLAVNLRVFLWGVLMAVVFGVVSGVYPAWRMARMHPLRALGEVRR